MTCVFKLRDLQARGKVFVGDGTCHAVVLVERSEVDTPLVEVWVHDDTNWFFKESFSAYWIPPLIGALQRALNTLDTQKLSIPTNCTRPHGHDGPCNGWPCDYVRKLYLGDEHVE